MSKTLRSGRLDWVDYAKGIGIILVVYGHVLIGIYNSKIDIPYFFYDFCQKFIYSFHMPLFFFLAGLFYKQKELITFKSYLSKKLKTIAYPYFIWSVIQGSIYAFMSSYTNEKFNLADLPFAIIIHPLKQLWFLYVLFAAHIILAFMKKCLTTNNYVILSVSAVIYLLNSYVKIQTLNRFMRMFVFYVLGVILAKWLFLKVESISVNTKQMCLISLLFICFQSIILQFNENTLLSFLMAYSGIAFVLCSSVYLSKKKLVDFIRYLGFLSMPIYLTHILVAVGTRIVLQKGINLNNGTLHILIGTGAGLLFPIILYIATKKLRFSYLFSLSK